MGAKDEARHPMRPRPDYLVERVAAIRRDPGRMTVRISSRRAPDRGEQKKEAPIQAASSSVSRL
jgi:hypothetical protein